MNLLFTSVGRRVELIQAFRAAADRLGVELSILGADMSPAAPALRFCEKALTVPGIRDPEYIPQLLKLCREHAVDCLIPTIDTDLQILAEAKQRFADGGTRVLISAPDRIAICRDKRLTASYFCGLGLAAPHPVDDISAYHGGFPAFIKPLDGSSSVNAHPAHSRSELEMLAKLVPNYIIQPYLSGREYTIDIFCDFSGKPIYITPRERLAVRAGEVLQTKICQDDTMIAEMKQLIADFQPVGQITVQLIRDDASGRNFYLEINPRFGGGAPLSMKAGADSAEALLRLLRGEQLEYVGYAARDGAVYSRFDQSICIDAGTAK